MALGPMDKGATMKIELWFFADWAGCSPGKHSSLYKVVDLPFLPRVGDAVLLGPNFFDTKVTEVCFDLPDDVISVGLSTVGLDQEEVDVLVREDGWICE